MLPADPAARAGSTPEASGDSSSETFGNKNMTRLIALLIFVCCSQLFAAEVTRTLTTGFVYKREDRIPFSVEARLVPFDPTMHKGRYFGADGGQPRFVCSSFDVSINERLITIPKKAVSDLGDITAVAPPFDYDGMWMITVEGGDAGGSYQIDFLFNEERLVERRIVDVFSPPKERKYKTQKY
jgi:hypothetical protein